MNPFRVVRSQPEMADDLARIQKLCFPTVGEAEIITAAQYRSHIATFPEGQLAVIDKQGTVVAGSTSCRCNLDLANYHHTYMEASGDNWLKNHVPDGPWLYGVDIGVHPDYRGQGLSKLLYDARKMLVYALGLRGILVGGMLKGYGPYRATMSPGEYAAQVASGTYFDPTLSVQLRRGFHIHGMLPHYIDDPTIDGAAALLVFHNDRLTHADS